MKEDVKVEKQFKGRLPEGGVVIAVAKLVNYGNPKPHFSVTTDGGAAHDLILRAIPELEPIVALHLSDEDGWPMHAVANAAYHAKQEDPKSLARHLRIPVPYARDLIDEMRWYVRDAIAVEKARVAELRDAWRAETSQLQKAQPRRYSETETWIKEARSTLRSFFRLRFNTSPRNRNAIVEQPEDPDNYSGRMVPRSIGYLTREQRELLKWALNPLPWRWKTGGGATLDELLKKYREVSKEISSIDERFVATEQRVARWTADYQQRFWKEAIEACFSACWKREALAAIELLKTASGRSKTLSEGPVPGPQVIFNGDAVNPIEIEPDGHLPRIDLGGRCYYLAADEETAREAVKRYCREMQQHSPEELVCLLGEETVRSWGLGQSVKIGDHQIDNFDDWVDLASNYPQAVWASYDGQTQRLEINEALAEAAGIDFDPDEEDPIWMEVLAYQC